jgi:hypothetical protein
MPVPLYRSIVHAIEKAIFDMQHLHDGDQPPLYLSHTSSALKLHGNSIAERSAHEEAVSGLIILLSMTSEAIIR